MAHDASNNVAEAELPLAVTEDSTPNYLEGLFGDHDYVIGVATHALVDLAEKEHSWEKAFDAFVPRVVQDGESCDSCISDFEAEDILEFRAELQDLFECVVALTNSWDPFCDAHRLAVLIDCGIKFSAAMGEYKGYRWALNRIEEKYGAADHAASDAVYAKSGDGTVVVDRNGTVATERYQRLPAEESEKVAQREHQRRERHNKANDTLAGDVQRRMCGMTPLAVKIKLKTEEIDRCLSSAKAAIVDLHAGNRDWNQACISTVSPLTAIWDSELNHLQRADQAPAEFPPRVQDFFHCIEDLLWAWRPDCNADRLASLINIANLLYRKGFGTYDYSTVLEKLSDKYSVGRHASGEKIYAITNDKQVVRDRRGKAVVEPDSPQ